MDTKKFSPPSPSHEGLILTYISLTYPFTILHIRRYGFIHAESTVERDRLQYKYGKTKECQNLKSNSYGLGVFIYLFIYLFRLIIQYSHFKITNSKT